MASSHFDIRRIYLYTLVIGTVILLALSLLASGSLDMATDDPGATYYQFIRFSDWLGNATLAVAVTLFILATWVHLQKGSGLYHLPALTILIVFANYNHGFLNSRFYEFKQYHDLWEGGFELGFLIGIAQSLLGLVLVMLLFSVVYFIRKRRRPTT